MVFVIIMGRVTVLVNQCRLIDRPELYIIPNKPMILLSTANLIRVYFCELLNKINITKCYCNEKYNPSTKASIFWYNVCKCILYTIHIIYVKKTTCDRVRSCSVVLLTEISERNAFRLFVNVIVCAIS